MGATTTQGRNGMSGDVTDRWVAVGSGPVSQVFTRENLRRTYGGKLLLLDQVGDRMAEGK